jgi:hypothetical protein
MTPNAALMEVAPAPSAVNAGMPDDVPAAPGFGKKC